MLPREGHWLLQVRSRAGFAHVEVTDAGGASAPLPARTQDDQNALDSNGLHARLRSKDSQGAHYRLVIALTTRSFGATSSAAMPFLRLSVIPSSAAAKSCG
jgi:hypothetical protein